MKKITGIHLLIFSILSTTLGSIFKITGYFVISDVFLGIGMVTCVIAISLILYRIARPMNSQRNKSN